jgi:hypothetical protein
VLMGMFCRRIGLRVANQANRLVPSNRRYRGTLRPGRLLCTRDQTHLRPGNAGNTVVVDAPVQSIDNNSGRDTIGRQRESA